MTTTTTTTPKITLDEVKRVLTEVAAEKPDYVYDKPGGTCIYTDADESASCLIGVFMDRVGLPRPAWGDLNNHQTVQHLAMTEGWDADAETLRVLENVQDFQDLGNTWGEAVARGLDPEVFDKP